MSYTAESLINTMARMRRTRDANDAIDTVNRLIAEARKIDTKIRRDKKSQTPSRIAEQIRDAAAETDSNDNEIEILANAFREAMARLTPALAREVRAEMKGYRCTES